MEQNNWRNKIFRLNKLLLHLGARCCEAAGQWKKDLTYRAIKSDQEWETDKFDVLQFYLDRNKTSTNGQPVIFNHRKTILLDLYFALAMQFLLDEKDDPCVYPDFHAAVQGKKSGDSLDSKVSNNIHNTDWKCLLALKKSNVGNMIVVS